MASFQESRLRRKYSSFFAGRTFQCRTCCGGSGGVLLMQVCVSSVSYREWGLARATSTENEEESVEGNILISSRELVLLWMLP